MTRSWCHSCGAVFVGATHNCGWRTVTADRLRTLETAERALRSISTLPHDRLLHDARGIAQRALQTNHR